MRFLVAVALVVLVGCSDTSIRDCRPFSGQWNLSVSTEAVTTDGELYICSTACNAFSGTFVDSASHPVVGYTVEWIDKEMLPHWNIYLSIDPGTPSEITLEGEATLVFMGGEAFDAGSSVPGEWSAIR